MSSKSPVVDSRPSGIPSVHRERARVVAVDTAPDKPQAQVWVEVFARSTCGDCSASTTCGQGVLSRWFQRKARCYPIECERQQAALLTVGRWVEIEIPEGALTRASLYVFVLPLLGMLAGALSFNAIAHSESGVALGGLLGFTGGFFWARRATLHNQAGAMQPRLCGLE